MATRDATPGELLGGKISAKEVGFSKANILQLVLNERTSDVFLFRVIGQATDLQAYKSKFEDREEEEEGFGLLGQFEATTNSGEVFTGQTLYLPKFAQSMVVGAVKNGNNVGVALDIYAAFDEEAATSYVFKVRSLLEPDRSAIDALKKSIGNTPMPALPAPKK